MHRAQAEMATERGGEYNPYESERRLDDIPEPDPIEDAIPVTEKEP